MSLMNIKKIDHIGIVVKSISDAIPTYERILGLEFLHKEHNEAFQCDIAFFQCGNVLVELVEPLGPSLAKTWLETNGEGINHICYEVDDINEAFQEAKENGLTDYEKPLIGAGDSKVFFLRPERLCSVQTEIVELK